MRSKAAEIGLLLLLAACAGSSAPGVAARSGPAPSMAISDSGFETSRVPTVSQAAPSSPPGLPSAPGGGPALLRPSADAGLAGSAASSLGTPPRHVVVPLSASDGSAGDAQLAAGDAAFERGDVSTARLNYASAQSAAPAKPGPAVGLLRARMAALDVPLDYGAAKGNRELTVIARDLGRITKTSPAFGPAFVELGRALLLLGDAPGAIEALQQSTRLLPDEAEAQSQLAVALLATGHADGAVRGFSRAVEIDPGSAARHGNLGTALMMNGRTKEAIAEYEIRVRIDDSDPRAHSDLGTALLGTQDLERALSELRRAVQMDPQRATFHQNLGFALQEGGQIDSAVAEYRDALRLDSKLVSAWINLATALARDPSKRAEARAALERARRLSPDDPRVRANFEELDALENGAVKRGGDAGAGRH